MEFNFLNNMFISSYPSISPLISPFQQTDPFIQEDLDEDSYDNAKELYNHVKEDINDSNNNKSEFLEKREKENVEESLEISPKISEIMQSQNPFIEKEENEQIYFEKEKKQKTTNVTTDKTKNGKIELKAEKNIFGLETKKEMEILPRIDYAIKNFKVTAVKYIKEYGNSLIKECKFKGELKNKKLFSPSNKYFTGISNEKENNIFLDFTVAELLSYPNDEFGEIKDNRLQQNNKKIIDQIRESINNMKIITKEYRDLLDYFNMTFEEALMLFYESNEFSVYKESEKAKFLDSQFIKVKGFSLLKKNSFISMIRHQQNESAN
jgi:hypothetical protein